MTGLKARWWLTFTSSTVLASPLLLLGGVLMSLSNSDFVDPYWLDLSSKSTVGMLLLAPGFAALGAWDAARWRVLAAGASRTWVELLLRHLGVVAAMTAVAYFVSLAILFMRTPPVTGLPRLDVLAVGILTTTAYTVVGFVAGRFLPRFIAAPATFIVVWLWVAYTPAIQPFWLRNVTGNLGTSCCSLDRQLVSSALPAPTVVALALIAAAVVVLTWSRRLLAWLGSTVVVGIGLVMAATLVSGVGADPVEERTGNQDCINSGSMRLCAWPEHSDRLHNAAPVIAEAAGRLRDAGLSMPMVLRENTRSADWSFSLGAPDSATWQRVFATSPLNALPPACTNDNGGYWPAGESLPLATAWLLVKAGADPPKEAADETGAETKQLRSLLTSAASTQSSWFSSTLSAMKTCEPIP
jgi:hypothetical protein